MTKENVKKEVAKKEKQSVENYVGEHFEDLSEDEMAKLQGQGSDTEGRNLGAVMDMILSKGNYKC
ncbi:lichenicidin A2 family type 2 lantibiotic [Enterococcus sp. RIT-PI-f]|uniref:lichenicidin A2 family type 2 lantibiotic n=1 Tax=Enterococcus sp. RIT-PI-f TaxID=1690244 RepID=UPI0006B9F6FD|nr:lichenicidin A2 family type 2 lantibiotic [Enterococcus sp. RIT-PI-f]KPG69953.1 hypothetical protein AEQ18_11080 [Enterococcus sp. RIT-PI-f]